MSQNELARSTIAATIACRPLQWLYSVTGIGGGLQEACGLVEEVRAAT
jgi:hypothetical protein